MHRQTGPSIRPTEAGGGVFHVFISEAGIKVITARGHRHFIYSTGGALLSAEHYAGNSYDLFPRKGFSRTVPTAPRFWTFTSPFYSWVVGMLGMLMLILKDKAFRKINRGTWAVDVRDVIAVGSAVGCAER